MIVLAQHLFRLGCMLGLFLASASFVRADEPLGLYYRLRVGISLQPCMPNGSSTGEGREVPPDGSKFTITGLFGTDQYVIRFWTWRKAKVRIRIGGNNAAEGNKLYDTFNMRTRPVLDKAGNPEKDKSGVSQSALQTVYFLISKNELGLFAEPLSPQWSPLLGGAVLPFKWRSQTGDFSDGLTVEGMGGWNYHFSRNKEHSIGLVLGIGIASVTYDSLSTKVAPSEDSNQSAISISAGVVYQWQRLQIMAITGWDHLQGAQANNWCYQGRPWFGIGIGAAIFNLSDAKAKEGSQGTSSK